jgi:hypothetical protein
VSGIAINKLNRDIKLFATAPNWYSTYRFYLSIIVGFSIIATLSGTSYYGAGSGAARTSIPGKGDVTSAKVSSSKRLEKVSAKNHPSVAGKQEGKVGGDVIAEDLVAQESGEGFVKLRNKEKEAEQAEKEEEEKREKASTEAPPDLFQICLCQR